MFERYTEKARRTIFFARYEASQLGSLYIETEHLLMGLLREDKALANRILGSYAAVESIRKQIEGRRAAGEKRAISVDLPLSQECKRALAYGAGESERLSHSYIDTEHLLLGLLRDEKCFAARLLREHGIGLDSVRVQISGQLPAQGESGCFGRVKQWLADCEARGGVWSVGQKRVGDRIRHFAIYAVDREKEEEKNDHPTSAEENPRLLREQFNLGETPPHTPLLCIAIVHDEPFGEVQKFCEDYLAEGVAEVWLLDPEHRRAYTVTKAEGLREFRGGILRIANPVLELNLRKIFDPERATAAE